MSFDLVESGEPAIIGARTLSYRDLARRARTVAAQLDLAPGSRIAFVAEATEPCIALVHAVIARGHVALPMHARWTEAERARWIEIARADLVVRDAGAFVDGDADAGWPAPRDSDPLAILSTSGTSGAPKAAVLSRRAFLASARAAHAVLPLGPGDRWLLNLPLAHVGGLSIVTRSLLARSAVVLPDPGPFDPERFVAAIERGRVTFASIVPAMLHRIVAARLRAPSSLRAVLVGGAAASPELVSSARALGYPVRATYGLTEACSQVATDDVHGRLRPLPGIEVAVDETIRVRGPTLFDGYSSDGAIECPLRDGWLDTGDLGALHDGVLTVLGRRDERIVTGGENVDPLEVERALEANLRARTCVFGLADPAFGHIVCAAIEGSKADIEGAVADLAPFKRPRRVFYVDAIPEVGPGKPDRKRAAALFADRAPDWKR
jgi:O-succinylbenzoic acid--CoA ligase